MRFRACSGAVAMTLVAAVGCSPRAPVPSGYVFPTVDARSGGMAALMSGTLVAERGCLYLEQAAGHRWLVIWPDTVSLVLDEGVPVLVEGGAEVGRAGSRVEVGGGEASRRPSGTGDCAGPFWVGSEIIRAEGGIQ